MLNKEAKWIGKTIKSILEKNQQVKLLNIGSSTKNFREVEQPFINSLIFEPFIKGGGKVVHTDIKQDEGVDLVGDLYDNKFIKSLQANKFDIILCSNLLEHLTNPKEICDLLSEIVNKHGYIIMTVPYVYPYHNDPIDTLFRPNVQQIFDLFDSNKFKVIDSEITIEDFSILTRPKGLLVHILKTFMPFYKPSQWKYVIKDYKIINKNFRVTCALLQKNI